MEQDGYRFMTDSISKFFHTVRVFGWFFHPHDRLKSVQLNDPLTINAVSGVGIEHGGVLSLGHNLGFEVQALRSTAEDISPDVEIIFTTERGKSIVAKLSDLATDRILAYSTPRQGQEFRAMLSSVKNAKILDVGGRARSKLDRSREWKGAEVTVLDIVPGDNVDVVGDAHALSQFFPAEHFDAFYSVSVFEHLLMPWTVVTELNRVLKTGGVGLVHTHQTLGMHDLPWDFWRFSDTAWDALFNRKTGFEIVTRSLDSEQYVIPFIYTPNKRDAEKSAGYEGSAVTVRKIGPSQLSWPVTPSDLISTSYPTHEDGNELGAYSTSLSKA